MTSTRTKKGSQQTIKTPVMMAKILAVLRSFFVSRLSLLRFGLLADFLGRRLASTTSPRFELLSQETLSSEGSSRVVDPEEVARLSSERVNELAPVLPTAAS